MIIISFAEPIHIAEFILRIVKEWMAFFEVTGEINDDNLNVIL